MYRLIKPTKNSHQNIGDPWYARDYTFVLCDFMGTWG